MPNTGGSEKRIAALDAALAKGISDVEAKRTMPAEEVFDRLEAKYRELAQGQKPKPPRNGD
ncbi:MULTISPECIES: hypothetical protein [unclassified Mesorhizobium]|uniref:hypothetical protein n=1 Tax=unclassified Mesorhizobium TaxID=325217 RepID=UPI000F75B4D0|nr:MULTISPECIES: hypothetical protein [unclassified Mesorhizobium]AZO02697.1 hypothetical protein EJ068_06045 [Mesorhizobium sp. M2A.F.Ca.ET.043.02.1.1]RUW39562.1 hypothetical protein EOA37_19205 [Mesorhizobium sp. M2A.F.Ca.ET.015.02.1.1]RUW76822.1 hypothetical protein EOA28_13070 [Mesorhizobium sp. M2A.F.Ca.ET.067.02.1.1]RVC94823.1 hypothetical protein EN739_15575 [Mesorhizobium sp. M2A.F.Ca.ET.017.03.2.1]RVD09928.1 hypothetical protein EN753_08375 [Mesorhizobium sp. M2A.F.Ca.ET.029.05.1.1]